MSQRSRIEIVQPQGLAVRERERERRREQPAASACSHSVATPTPYASRRGSWRWVGRHGFLVSLALISLFGHLLIHIFAAQLSEAVGANQRHTREEVNRFVAGSVGRRASVGGARGGALLPVASNGAQCERTLDVLLIHEHHLKAIGSDMRLLGLLMQLRGQGHRVSLLFRGKVPSGERSPPTRELFRIINGPELEDPQQLGGGVIPLQHPGIYEMVDLAGLSRLASQGWFDAVLCSFWFWRDPAPSSAELLLPTLLARAPRGRRPFIGVLSDDAHSAKAAMMAEWEPSEERRAFWREKMRSLPPRQAAVYSLADAVVHISDADSKLERSAFNTSAKAWLVVHMSLRSFTREASPTAPAMRGALAPPEKRGALYTGFVGNGVTPTNHLAIEWFLKKVWPDIRLRHPALRLRLVGLPPDDRPKKRHGLPCKPDSPTRCGWAWGTQYAGREADNGIDTLGFLSDSDFLAELHSWHVMVVPILRSTGVNTKLLPALQWGVPIVLTTVAANPLAIPTDDSVALIADDEMAFVEQLVRVLSEPSLWRMLSSASSAHWQTLLAADHDAADVRQLMSLACSVCGDADEARPLALPHAPRGAARRLLDDLKSARQHSHSKCFSTHVPALLITLHGASAGEGPALWVHELWEGICRHCDLRCFHGAGGRRARERWDVIVEHELTLEPTRLARGVAAAATAISPRQLKIIHLASSPWHAALRYSARGASLTSTVMSESADAQLHGALSAVGLPADDILWRSHLDPLHNGSAATIGAGVRSVLRFIGGVIPREETRLVDMAESIYTHFVRHETSPRWVGCFRDSAADRDLPDGPRTFGHTTQSCAAACTGYAYMALQGGGQCFCGHTHGMGANHSQVSENKCGRVCPGEDGKTPVRWCGSAWRNALYAQARGSTAASQANPKPLGVGRATKTGTDYKGISLPKVPW